MLDLFYATRSDFDQTFTNVRRQAYICNSGFLTGAPGMQKIVAPIKSSAPPGPQGIARQPTVTLRFL